MKNISKVVETFSRTLDMIAGYFLLVTMGLIVVNVVLRTVFNKPISGTIELVEIFAAVTAGLALAYCGFLCEHVEIDFIWAKLPKKIRIVTKVIVDLLSMTFLLLATRMLWVYGDSLRIRGRVSATMGLPYYWFVYVVAIGFFIYSLILLIRIIDQFRGRWQV